MKRIFISLILSLFIAAPALAEPFLASDPLPGADEFVIDCTGYDPIQTPAVAEAIYFDLANWPYGGGWFDCSAAATESYTVIDEVTQIETSVSAPGPTSPFRMKIPKNGKAKNYRVRE